MSKDFTWRNMIFNDWAIVTATLLGPILAVQAQKWIERATERRRRKHWIFETLMATRATRLDPTHVRALNQIDLDFAPQKIFGIPIHRGNDKAALKAWREYADILNEQHEDESALKAWLQRADDAFTSLMFAIAKAQGHSIDKPQIRRGIYSPKAFSDSERRQLMIQDSLARILEGHSSLKMEVTSFPGPGEDQLLRQKALQDRLLKVFPPDGILRVDMRQSEKPKK